MEKIIQLIKTIIGQKAFQAFIEATVYLMYEEIRQIAIDLEGDTDAFTDL